LSSKQTNRNFKITFESNIALGAQQILALLEHQTSLFIAVEFLSLQTANFSSNRNVPFMSAVVAHPASSSFERVLQTNAWPH